MDSCYKVESRNIIWLLMNFYRQNKLYDSLLTLALESNVSIYEEEISEEMLYLQRLILQGR